MSGLERLNHDELYKLYWADNRTLDQIAQLYRVSRTTVTRWMNKHGIVRRGKRAAMTLEARKHLSIKLRKKFIACPSPVLGYILGVLLGDGFVYKSVESRGCSYRIGLHVKDRLFAKKFAKALNDLGLNSRMYVEKGGFYQARAISVGFYEWYKLLSLEQIVSLIRGFEKHFVCGFYESEGCVDTNKLGRLRVRMYNKRREVLSVIQEILRGWNINSWIYGADKKGCFTLETTGNKLVEELLHIINPSIKKYL